MKEHLGIAMPQDSQYGSGEQFVIKMKDKEIILVSLEGKGSAQKWYDAIKLVRMGLINSPEDIALLPWVRLVVAVGENSHPYR